MYVWLGLIGGSALVGCLVALTVKHHLAIYLAAGLPWVLLLCALVYSVYFLPYDAPDASMWIVAQAIGGTVAAIVGWCAFKTTKRILDAKEHS